MNADIDPGQVRIRLYAEFGEHCTPEVIDRFVERAFDEMVDHAPTERSVPVLAERFARQQLTAETRLKGQDGSRAAVLFVDEDDAGRSQLARALFERHSDGRVHSWSGGLEAATEIDERVAVALADYEIDMTQQYPKPLTDEIIASADLVIVLGDLEGVMLPDGIRTDEWMLPDLTTLDDWQLATLAAEVDQMAEALARSLMAGDASDPDEVSAVGDSVDEADDSLHW